MGELVAECGECGAYRTTHSLHTTTRSQSGPRLHTPHTPHSAAAPHTHCTSPHFWLPDSQLPTLEPLLLTRCPRRPRGEDERGGGGAAHPWQGGLTRKHQLRGVRQDGPRSVRGAGAGAGAGAEGAGAGAGGEGGNGGEG